MTRTAFKVPFCLLALLRIRLSGVLILTLFTLTASGCATTRNHPLVITPEQYDAVEASTDDEPPLRGRVERGAPVIVVETPDPGSDVRTPFEVRVSFQPQEEATIALDTLKVKYGFFDVTKEVLQRMMVNGSGLVGQIDAIKPGNYKLRVSISDDRQRTGRATLSFHIVN